MAARGVTLKMNFLQKINQRAANLLLSLRFALKKVDILFKNISIPCIEKSIYKVNLFTLN